MGDRKVLRAQYVAIPPVGLQVQRDEVHACTDAGLGESGDEVVSRDFERIQAELQHVQVPGMRVFGVAHRRQVDRQVRESAAS